VVAVWSSDRLVAMSPPVCRAHIVAQPGLCEICAKRARYTRARTRTLAVAGGAIVVVTAIVVFLQTRPAKATPPPAPEMDLLEKYKRERLASNKCDVTAIQDLVEHLMRASRWQPALDVVQQAHEDCGDIDALDLDVIACLQQLNRWAEVAAKVDKLIERAPREAAYWWWHGEAERYRDRDELALVDFRQSLANQYYFYKSSGVTRQLMYAAEATKQECEADRAWRFYQRSLDGTIDDEAHSLVAALERAKTCVPERGTGHGTIVEGKKLTVTIGSTTTKLMLDPRAGTTIISRDVAERAGIVASVKDSTATLWSEVRLQGQPARIAKLTVGSLAATNVDVVISDELATGDDGVIGLSFLWHWDIEREDGRVRLVPQQ
jgi:predicted aspartyl protease